MSLAKPFLHTVAVHSQKIWVQNLGGQVALETLSHGNLAYYTTILDVTQTWSQTLTSYSDAAQASDRVDISS